MVDASVFGAKGKNQKMYYNAQAGMIDAGKVKLPNNGETKNYTLADGSVLEVKGYKIGGMWHNAAVDETHVDMSIMAKDGTNKSTLAMFSYGKNGDFSKTESKEYIKILAESKINNNRFGPYTWKHK